METYGIISPTIVFEYNQTLIEEVVNFIRVNTYKIQSNNIRKDEIKIQLPKHWEQLFFQYYHRTRMFGNNPPMPLGERIIFDGLEILFIAPTHECFVYWVDYMMHPNVPGTCFRKSLTLQGLQTQQQ